MPPSQLKRLKASLRDQGLVGPQKSKKQKKSSQNGNVDQRLQRQAALQQIRDSFNPFEIKAPARNAKFASMSDRNAPVTVGRPGVTKSMGEKTRRQNLLPELQTRNKSGGIVDRRIGEDDATMTPEERALQRFIREKQRRKNGGLFDLEGDDEEPQTGLTHLGRALDLEDGETGVDDFDEVLSGSDDATSQDGSGLLKRRRTSAGSELEVGEQSEGDLEEVEGPARKRSKHEVMKEVMAKSKLHKYERQKAKEDDDDLRAKLDSELGDLMSLLHGRKVEPPKTNGAISEPTVNADRLAMMQGKPREVADKEYDSRLRQLALDQRAAPADRTKTEEEKAKDEAERLKKLEEARQRRMRGEEADESGDDREKAAKRSGRGGGDDDDMDMQDDVESVRDDAAEFGLGVASTKTKMPVLDDEDEFELDEDLVASDSEVDSESDGEESDEHLTNGDDEDEQAEDEEDEFVRGILDDDQKHTKPADRTGGNSGVAFTYPCPRSHEELLSVFESVKMEDYPIVIQRIRALYHPSLSSDNKTQISDFSVALVDHISYMAEHGQSLAVIETIIRHLHSLSRTYPQAIGQAFRNHLSVAHERGSLSKGDLVILTAIGSIYPTSDHFHQVVTPAITLAARWLEFTMPTTNAELRTGAFLVSLILSFQRLSMRYVPEAVRFTLKALQVKPQPAGDLTEVHVANLLALAEQYRHLPAFTEIFAPAALVELQSLKDLKSVKHLQILLSQARLARRPLELHHHRPLPIRSSVPKFEENFMPGKHYDPDKERSDAAKLRKEYKREKKGAVRELRKDANFIAREQLREKKEKDAAYEKKFRRLVAEINSEEGREGNQYEREREKRKKAKQ
ncbi:hypothetical protein CAC42_5791 [Sphaceloma murrayae]|uniref:Nucleolar complex protein 14 n=1 Tax=Sphaceloma murrayae TaxID=2082308 RepID=A0A2K1QZ70_9PEZI|nr:hypothetical protein CAC42_5791 [Sphaceloma murrayae]